ncbi:glycosyltransferase family 10 domain-containing protein [Tunicatimonas pelagia]|uniref:glycosyltransferase family 10 domain-containing protein n=1 Tax=Tunicatimonas pelagia TaxID=931531 RepID=UPI0026652577|nr:glycosyltransferase family 10 [Tunicatimonas pelagia]WKN44447.1 glycosyltransferase family 10 [Tunicatimonas pelagia]
MKSKTLVRVVKDWGYPERLNLFAQTPHASGIWDNIEFTDEEVDECDYLIIFKNPKKHIKVRCRYTWLISHEPPIIRNRYFINSFKHFDNVFSYYDCPNTTVERTHPLIPWMVFKSYDELTNLKLSEAKLAKGHNRITWVTSNQRNLKGQVARMNFKDYLLTKSVVMDIFGKGFIEVNDKFDVLFPYKYAMAIENFSHQNYWSEKIADCLLSYCLPFYWGAPNLEAFLPRESFVRIDINKPEQALRTILDTINGDEWEKRIDAISEARNIILNKHQFFPAISALIQKNTNEQFLNEKRERSIPANPIPKRITITDQLSYYKKRISRALALS